MGCGQSARRRFNTFKENLPKGQVESNDQISQHSKLSTESGNLTKSKQAIASGNINSTCSLYEPNVESKGDLDGEYENPESASRLICPVTIKQMDNKWVYIFNGQIIKIEDVASSETSNQTKTPAAIIS